MVFHTAGFYKADQNATLLPIQPIADDCVTWYGDDLTVPELNNLLAFLLFGLTPTQAQIQAPSLRRIFQEDIDRMIATVTCENADEYIIDLKEQPLILDVAEKLNVLAKYGAGACYALLWLGDGAIIPVSGEIHTIRGELEVTTTAAIWENCALTLKQTLPAGRYQVVGARAYGTNMLAARLIFTGHPWRPGIPAGVNYSSVDCKRFRKGRFGAFGEFEFDQPPQVEVLSSAATSTPEIFLDLIQIRAGR